MNGRMDHSGEDERAFAEGHLPGARLVPSGVSVERWIPQRFGTGSPVVLYDAGGDDRTAAHEASHLSHLWFRGLFVLKGGLAAWREAGLPLEEGDPVDPLGVGRDPQPAPSTGDIIPEVYDPRRGKKGGATDATA